ncbi:MAG TPA: hypothetical protein ENH94_08040 [Phycisphaerales bacterium]|nr:hypothetical protein [Phycisphaerales bacterium]
MAFSDIMMVMALVGSGYCSIIRSRDFYRSYKADNKGCDLRKFKVFLIAGILFVLGGVIYLVFET